MYGMSDMWDQFFGDFLGGVHGDHTPTHKRAKNLSELAFWFTQFAYACSRANAVGREEVKEAA
jgi:hypothetical protein